MYVNKDKLNYDIAHADHITKMMSEPRALIRQLFGYHWKILFNYKYKFTICILTYVSFATALAFTAMLSCRSSTLISSIHCAMYLACNFRIMKLYGTRLEDKPVYLLFKLKITRNVE